MERKRFVDCPECNGNGHLTVRCWAFDGAVKCSYCKGFGLMSIADRIQYHDDTQLTLTNNNK